MPCLAGSRGQSWTLTFCVRDGAGDGRAGGGDGAQGGTHAIGREGASHGCSVGDPGCRVDGPDGLAYREDEKSEAAHPAHCQAQQGRYKDLRQQRKERQGSRMPRSSYRATPIHLLLGRVKQPRGLGSQHLATVRVMGLKARVTLVRAGCMEARPTPLPDNQKCLPPPSQCPIPSIPRFVHNLPQYPDCVIIAHVLKVDLVYLGERDRSGISSWVGEVGREEELGGSGLPPKKWPLNEQGTEERDISLLLIHTTTPGGQWYL